MAKLVAEKTKVLERAAKTIQRPIHASMLRKEFLLLRKAAIDIQSLCRGTTPSLKAQFHFSLYEYLCIMKKHLRLLVLAQDTVLYMNNEYKLWISNYI